MQNQIKASSGIYILEIAAEKIFNVSVLKFAEISFPKGYYYYVGSAQKNLGKRLQRHIRKEKILHWHIDHLTSRKNNKIKSIYIWEGKGKDYECRLTSELQNELNLKSLVKGFGNSDCSNCNSHLLYSQHRLPYSQLLARYQSMVRFIPSSSDTF